MNSSVVSRLAAGALSFALAFSASIAAHAATKLATFVGFDTLTNGAYKADVGNNTVAANGYVPITKSALDFNTTTNWAGSEGISVLVKYSSLPTSCEATLATVDITGRTSDSVGICAWYTSSGCYFDPVQLGSVGYGQTRYSFGSSGYYLLTYSDDANGLTGIGTVLYDGEGTQLFNQGSLKYSGSNVGTLHVGGFSTDSNLANGMMVEGAIVYSGVVTAADAVKDYEAAVAAKEAEAEAAGAACLYDWTFTNTVRTASTSTNQVTMKCDVGPYYLEKKAVAGYCHPYCDFTFNPGESLVYYGTAPATAGTVMFDVGRSASFILVGTAPAAARVDGSLRLQTSYGYADFTVENPATVPHLYELTCDSDTGTMLTLKVDGVVKAENITCAATLKGLQLGNMYGGVSGTSWSSVQKTDALCYVNAFRVYNQALSTAETQKLLTEFADGAITRSANMSLYRTDNGWCAADLVSSLAPMAGDTLVIDSANLSTGTFTATKGDDFITMVKGTNFTVKVYGSSGISFGSQSSKILSTFDYVSGTHALTWCGSQANMNFGSTSTPVVHVEKDVMLNFTAKDITGWNADAKDKVPFNVIEVDEGGTLNLKQSSGDTFFYQGQLKLLPGSTVTTDYESGYFRLNGGIYEDYPQILVPDSSEGSTPAVITNATTASDLKLASNATRGYGIYVGENATLRIYNDLASEGAYTLAKYGEGTLELYGSFVTGTTTNFTGTISVKAGTLVYDGHTFGIGDYTVAQLLSASYVAMVNGISYDTLAAAVSAAGANGTVKLLVDLEEVSAEADALGVTLTAVEGEEATYTVTCLMAKGSTLVFSEIMPKPSDKPYDITTQTGYDKHGLESGWVEVYNTSSNRWADLGNYLFCNANRGKKYTSKSYGNFPSVLVAPGGYFTFYTSERYANSAPAGDDDPNATAFTEGTFDGKPIWYDGMLIWGDKTNPKKYPYVTLVWSPNGENTIVDSVVIPSDVPEGNSIVVGAADGGYTKRWICSAPTINEANGSTSGLPAIGPNVGPLYGVKHSLSEFGAVKPAELGKPYTVTLDVNPVYRGTDADAITGVTLVYRTQLGKGSSGSVTMTPSATNETDGIIWTAEIPADAIPTTGGQLIQWKTKITDAAGNEWTSPSFHNSDDGYEWYGTITEPTEAQMSKNAKIPVWHIFIDDTNKAQMDKDSSYQTLANGARCSIYDNSTSNYYDYVRIDLRGHTSASFTKKGHGLRFNKVHPLTMTDCVTGKEISEIRKTSLISEFADPSYIRQMLSFWFFNRCDSPAPFDFPVRCNLNGEFYEVAFNSERFTDELVEDVYKLDKYGYSYKNIGCFSGTTSAGGIEKKTPDDGNESDLARLKTFMGKITAASKVATGTDATSATTGLENDTLTKVAATDMDLPRWFNYLAIARITTECDDIWANLSGYIDDAQMLEGSRGTGTIRPLVYDTNLSWGQHYNDGGVSNYKGLKADYDWFKSHPFYGGFRIRAYGSPSLDSTVGNANYAVETIWQHEKYRRLYLRRLRTLMDSELKETAADATFDTDDSPIVRQMRAFVDLLKDDAAADRTKWPDDSSDSAIDVWASGSKPADMEAGVREIYTDYIVPRRTHLFVTHSITNTAKGVGYATSLAAGIPAAQSPIASLKSGFGAVAIDGGVMITNLNAETVDMSGWKLTGCVSMSLPTGTVIDLATNGVAGALYVVTDRKTFVANNTWITDEIIVGNATAGEGEIGLTTADDTVVIKAATVLTPGDYSNLSYNDSVSLSGSGSYTFRGVAFNGGLVIPEGSYEIKNQKSYTNTALLVTGPAANIAFTGKGTFSLAGEKTSGTLMTVNDLYVSNGTFKVESKAQTSETCAVVVNGNFAVESEGIVDMKLTKNAAQGRGIFMASKDMKCRIGTGGKFIAEINGPGCRAIQGDKGSVNLNIKEGATVTVTGGDKATDARIFKMKGKIKIDGGDVTIEANGSGTEIFSCDKSFEMTGGNLNLKSTDDCVSAAEGIIISGGTIVGESTGNDVLDSNTSIDISGGTLALIATTEECEGLDCDPEGGSGKLTITGGTVYATGGTGAYWHTPEAGGQDWVTITGDYDSESWIMVTVPDGNAAVTNVVTGCKVPAGAKTFFVSMAGATRDSVVCGEKSASATSETAVLAPWIYTWNEVTAVTVTVVPGEAAELSATDAESAAIEAGKVVIVLSDYDTEAGLTTNSLVVVAEAVTNAAGEVTGYRAVVAVNPDTVAVPTVGVGTNTEQEVIAPLAFEETTEEGTAVSIGVNNAVKGLWYGYEVSDALGGDAGFANDLESFTRATGAAVKITGAKRTEASGFFRVKVLPAKPTK